MKRIYSCLVIFLVSLLFFKRSFAQAVLADSSFYNSSVINFTSAYRKEVGSNLQLYKGPEYVRNGQLAKGFPFFDSDSLINGIINYDGILYNGIEMHYDLVSDEVIINTNTHINLKPAIEKINFFFLNNHYFLRVVGKSPSSLLQTGFYEQLYSGSTFCVYSKHEKKLKFPSNTEDDVKYVATDYFFIKKNSDYYRIENKEDLLYILKDKKEELKKFIRVNKISFKKQPELAIKRTVEYYEKIKS